tara:strand:+ start:19334 stop:20011 length:678 start_codon:yes stop_codon:yes gene_type:complete
MFVAIIFIDFKKMKINVWVLMLGVTLAMGSCAGNTAKEGEDEIYYDAPEDARNSGAVYMINPEKSYIEWYGNMVGMYEHSGRVRFNEGSLVLEDMNIKRGDFIVEMNTIESTDSDDLYEDASREDLVNHLKSGDFFYTQQFPSAMFELINHKGSEINGLLTIKGVTKPVTVTDVEVGVRENLIKVFGTLVFDRREFDVHFEYPVKDMVISNDIELDIVIYGEIAG